MASVQKDAISWFFGCLRQTGGCYARPSNYKNPAGMRAEAMEGDPARERETGERVASAELELEFSGDPRGHSRHITGSGGLGCCRPSRR